MLSPIDEPLAVYVRAKTALRPAGAYSDVSDREWFGLPNDDEEGVPCVVPVGGVLIMEECEAMRINATPEAVRDTFTMPFLWGSIVGVVGVIVLIVGIVLLVKVNGKRRLIMREAMMRAAR